MNDDKPKKIRKIRTPREPKIKQIKQTRQYTQKETEQRQIYIKPVFYITFDDN